MVSHVLLWHLKSKSVSVAPLRHPCIRDASVCFFLHPPVLSRPRLRSLLFSCALSLCSHSAASLPVPAHLFLCYSPCSRVQYLCCTFTFDTVSPVHLLCLLIANCSRDCSHTSILLTARGPFFPQSLTDPHSLVHWSPTPMVFWYFFILNDGQTEGHVCHWHHQ